MSSLRDDQNFFTAPRTKEEEPFFSRSGILSAENDAALTRSGMSELRRGYEAARLQGEASYLAADEATARRVGDVRRADSLRAQIGGLQQRAQAIGPSVPEFTDLELDPRKDQFSLRKAGDWFAGAVGNAAGSMVDPILAGGAANLTGKVMQGIGVLPHPVAKGIGAAGKAISTFGTPAAAFVPNVLQARGATYNSMVRDEELMNTTTDVQRDNAAWGSGVLQAIPDTVLPTLAVRGVLGDGLIKGAAKLPTSAKVVGGSLLEGGTEVLQGRIEKGALSYLNPNRDTSEDTKDDINNFAAGLAGGSAISTAASVADSGWNRLSTIRDGSGEPGEEIDLNDPDGETKKKPNVLESLVPKSKYKSRAEAQARANMLLGLDEEGTYDINEMAGLRKKSILEELSKINSPEARQYIEQVERVDTSNPESLFDPALDDAADFVLPKVGLATEDFARMKNNAEFPFTTVETKENELKEGQRVSPDNLGGKRLKFSEQALLGLDETNLTPVQKEKIKAEAESRNAQAELLNIKAWDRFEKAGGDKESKDWIRGLTDEITALATVKKPSDAQIRRVGRLSEDLVNAFGADAQNTVQEAMRITGGSPLMDELNNQLAAYAKDKLITRLKKQAKSREDAAAQLAGIMTVEAEAEVFKKHAIDLSNPQHREDILQLFEDYVDAKSSAPLKLLNDTFGKEFTSSAIEFVGSRVNPMLFDKPLTEKAPAQVEADIDDDVRDETSEFDKAGQERALEKIAPEAMVFHHGPSKQVRDAKDAFTEQKNSKGEMDLPQLVRLDHEGNEEVFKGRLDALNKKAEDALGDQRDRYAVSTISAKDMMDRQNLSPQKRVDLMLKYLRKEKHPQAEEIGGMVDVLSKLERAHKIMSELTDGRSSLSPDGRKLSINERISMQDGKVKSAVRMLRPLVPEATAERINEILRTSGNRVTKTLEIAKIAKEALGFAQKHLTEVDEFQELSDKLGLGEIDGPTQLANAFFSKHFLSVAEQPGTRDYLQLSISEFRAMADKGAKNAKSAYVAGGGDKAGEAAARASMNLIHFDRPDTDAESGKNKEASTPYSIPAHMLVDWVRSMRDAHEVVTDPKNSDPRGDSKSITRQTEDYRRLLLEGISAVMTQGYSKGMPYIINSAGEKEYFTTTKENVAAAIPGEKDKNRAKLQAQRGGLPPSLDLNGVSEAQFESNKRKAQAVKENKEKQHTVITKKQAEQAQRELEDTYKEPPSTGDAQPLLSKDEDGEDGLMMSWDGDKTREEEKDNVMRLSNVMGSAVQSPVRALNRTQARTMAGRRASELREQYLSKRDDASLENILDLARTMRTEKNGHYVLPLAALLTPKFMSEIKGLKHERILNELRSLIAEHLYGGRQTDSINALEARTAVDYLSGYNDMKVNQALDARPPSDPVQREEWEKHRNTPLKWRGEKIAASAIDDFLAGVAAEHKAAADIVGKRAEAEPAGDVPAARKMSAQERADRDREADLLQTIRDMTDAGKTGREIVEARRELAQMAKEKRTAKHYDALYLSGQNEGASSTETASIKGKSKPLVRKMTEERRKKAEVSAESRRLDPSVYGRTPSLGTAESKVKNVHTVSTLTTALQKMFKGADVSKAVSVFQTVAEALRAADIKIQDALLSVKSDRLGLTGIEKVWFQTFEHTMPKELFTEALKQKAKGDWTWGLPPVLSEYAKTETAAVMELFPRRIFLKHITEKESLFRKERVAKIAAARDAQVERLIAAYEAGAMLDEDALRELKRHLTLNQRERLVMADALLDKQRASLHSALSGMPYDPITSHIVASALKKYYDKNPTGLMELDPQIVSNTFERMAKNPNGGGFLQHYEKLLTESDRAAQIKDQDGGVWRKYSGRDQANVLAARAASGWCTSSPRMAEQQLGGGDFYVYSDKNGTTQLALRLRGSGIGEMQDRSNSGTILAEDKAKFEFIAEHIWPQNKEALEDMRRKFSVRRNNTEESGFDRKTIIAYARLLGKELSSAERIFETLKLIGVPVYKYKDGLGIAGDLDVSETASKLSSLNSQVSHQLPEGFHNDLINFIARVDGDLTRNLRQTQLGINDDDLDFDPEAELYRPSELYDSHYQTLANLTVEVGGKMFFNAGSVADVADLGRSINLLETRMLYANGPEKADAIREYARAFREAVKSNPKRIPYHFRFGPARSIRAASVFDPEGDPYLFESSELDSLPLNPSITYKTPPNHQFGPYRMNNLEGFDPGPARTGTPPPGYGSRRPDWVVPPPDDDFDEIPFSRRTDGAIQGFYDPKGKKTYLVADNVAKGDEMAVVLHEVGVHLGMEKLLGKERYKQLVGQIKKWETEGFGLNKKIAQAARARLEAAGVEGKQTDHELVAYFVEEAVKAGIDPSKLNAGQLGKWLNQVWDAVKTALSSLGWDTSKLQARDVVAIAYGAARIQMGDKKPGKKEVQGYMSEKAKAEVEAKTRVETALPPSNFTNHSGGAIGADSMFDTIGSSLGFTKHNHYYHGRQTPKGNMALTDAQVAEGIVHAKKAAAALKRPWSDKYASLLGRNWFQVKNATQVIAIAPLITPGETNSAGFVSKADRVTVDGGTGYAVEMAIANGKEVHVFDTKTNQWFSWDGEQFAKSGVPTLAQNYAGIGSRQDKGVMTKESVQAIRDVYEKASGVKYNAETVDGGSNTKPETNKKPRKPKFERQNALGMETVEGAAKNMNGPTPTALAVSSAMAHFKRTVSDKVKVIFAETFPEMKWGASFDTTTLLAKISTATPDRIMRYAYHESIHAMYATILKHHPEAKKLLESVMSSPAMVQRLKDLLVDSPDAISQMEADPEERVAYAYQFWQLGMLDIDKTPATFFAKVQAMLRRVFGTVRDSEKALALLEAFNKGELKEESAAAVAIRKVMATGEWQAKFKARFDKQIEAVFHEVMTAHDGLLNSESSALRDIAGMFWSNPADPESAGNTGVLDRRQQMKNKYLSQLYSAIAEFKGPNQERDLKAIVDVMNGKQGAPGEAVGKAAKKLHALLDHAYEYAKSAGVQLGERDKGNYFPVVWSVEELVERKQEFVDMLVREYPDVLKSAISALQESAPGSIATIEDVAEAIHQTLIDRGGIGDGALEAHREDGILNPFFASRNTRTLDWIRPEHRQPFLSTDLIATTTRYLDQIVRTAEYVRAFGPGGQLLKDMMAREGDVMIPGTSSTKPVLYEKDGPVVRELKEKAAELGLKEVEAEAWVNRRMVDAGRNMGAMEGVLGKDISETTRDVNSVIMAYQSIRLLTLSIFSSFLDVNGIKVSGGTWQNMLDAFVHGVTNVVGTWKDLLLGEELKTRGNKSDELIATTVGTISPTMFIEGMGAAHTSEYSSGKVREFNRKFFLANGMTAWDRSMRIMATKAAIQSIEANSRNEVPQHSARWLKQLGLEMGAVPTNEQGKLIVTPQELARSRGLVWSELTPQQAAELRAEVNKVHIAINRWVGRAIISPNAAQRPARGSDPRFAMFFQLKSFTYAFQKTTMTYALNEAEAGNPAAAAQMLVGMPIMIAADVTKAILTGGGSLPGYMANWTLVDWVNHAWGRAGGNGIGQFAVDMTNDPNGILSGVISTIGGPTVSQVLHPDLVQAVPVVNKLGGIAEAVTGLGDSGR